MNCPFLRLFLGRLKKAREDAGLPQFQAATASRRPQSHVSKCESGERRLEVDWSGLLRYRSHWLSFEAKHIKGPSRLAASAEKGHLYKAPYSLSSPKDAECIEFIERLSYELVVMDGQTFCRCRASIVQSERSRLRPQKSSKLRQSPCVCQ